MKKFYPSILCNSIAICFLFTSVNAQTFIPRYNSSIGNNINGYYEYLPKGYNDALNANVKYPIIFYLHGGTQIGANNNNNLEKLKDAGIPLAIANGKIPETFTSGGNSFSYIIISPQFKNEYFGSDVSAVINYIMSQSNNYRIDPARIYITGFSWGGRAVWQYLMGSTTNAQKIAAAIPIGQFCYPTPNMNNIRYPANEGVAVWALHNTHDQLAPASECAVNYVNRFNSYNPSIPAKVTVACMPSANQCTHLDITQNYIYDPTLFNLQGTSLNIYEWFYQYQKGTINTNYPPIANAGIDQTITLPQNSVSLSGSGSYSPNGFTLTYAWRKISGPQNYSIASPSNTNTTVNNLSEGTYGFELTVTDQNSSTDKDTVYVAVTESTIYSQRILIDMGSTDLTSSPDASGKYWNNMTDARPGIRIQNAKTTTNSPTSLTIEVLNRIDGTYNTGANGLNSINSTPSVNDYPSTATKDYAFSSPTTSSGSWKLSGLDNSKQYAVKFWGSKMDSYQRIIQIKQSDESTWKEYDASFNTDYNKAAVFTFSGKNEVTFNIRTKQGSQFGYINVIDINISDASSPSYALARPGSEDIQKANTGLYPNPAQNNITLSYTTKETGKVKLTIYNQQMQEIKQYNFIKVNDLFLENLDISNLNTGIYFMNIRTDNSNKTLRFIKTNNASR